MRLRGPEAARGRVHVDRDPLQRTKRLGSRPWAGPALDRFPCAECEGRACEPAIRTDRRTPAGPRRRHRAGARVNPFRGQWGGGIQRSSATQASTASASPSGVRARALGRHSLDLASRGSAHEPPRGRGPKGAVGAATGPHRPIRLAGAGSRPPHVTTPGPQEASSMRSGVRDVSKVEDWSQPRAGAPPHRPSPAPRPQPPTDRWARCRVEPRRAWRAPSWPVREGVGTSRWRRVGSLWRAPSSPKSASPSTSPSYEPTARRRDPRADSPTQHPWPQ
jgi:hypothetical protein